MSLFQDINSTFCRFYLLIIVKTSVHLKTHHKTEHRIFLLIAGLPVTRDCHSNISSSCYFFRQGLYFKYKPDRKTSKK
jgi:hypothetical protein